MNPDFPTSLAETEVTKMLHLKSLAEQIPDGFESGPRIIRNPIPGTGNSLPQKRPAPETTAAPKAPKTPRAAKSPKAVRSPKSPVAAKKPTKVKVHYTTGETESDPTSLAQAQLRSDWPMWEKAIEAEYASLRKHRVFGPTVTDLEKHPIGHRLIFSRKYDANGVVTRYKVRLVAQGFSQRPGVDFDQTYSPVMDTISFRFLLALTVQLSLHIFLLDVVTAYLHGVLDTKLFIVPPPGFLKNLPTAVPGRHTGLQILKALYGLKQAGRTWYHHLCNFLVSKGFVHNPTLPCIFTLSNTLGFVIVAVYVDDLNVIGVPELCKYTQELLVQQFDMKILGKTSYCLGLQIQHFNDGSMLLHQQSYVQKLLKNFSMDQAHPLTSPMIGRSKNKDDPYHPREEEEEVVDKQRYLTAVGAFTYLTTHTRPDIGFATSILARHSQNPTARHWNGVKHLMRYLRGTEDLGLYFRKSENRETTGYADSGFNTDEVAGKSQTGYIFLRDGAPVSWKSVKQTVTATSTNHAELLAFHEASREAVWLRTMEGIITKQCKITTTDRPTIIYEDNASCIRQMQSGFIKADRTKHISPHIFTFSQDLVDKGQIEIRKIESENNIADMLTKALPAYKHKKLVHAAGMRLLHELNQT